MTAHLNLALSLAACAAICAVHIRRNATALNVTLFACICDDHVSVCTCHLLQKSFLLLISLLCCVSAGDKIEKNEMGWACGAYG